MNIIDFTKDVYSIFEKNMRKCIHNYQINSIQDLYNFMTDLFKSFHKTINDVFKLKDIKRNNDLGKTESDKTIKDLKKQEIVEIRDNNQLDRFRDAQEISIIN